MASNSIKGLSVKIGADTSDFIKGLKAVDKEINQTQKTANELQKGLELDFDYGRFLQAQKQVQSALETTEAKSDAIRKQLDFLKESGGVNTEGYRKLETELAKTETNALKLRKQLEDLDKLEVENLKKDFQSVYKEIDKSSDALKTSSKNMAELSNKLKDSNVYGKDLKEVQEATKKELEESKKHADALRKSMNELKHEGIPVEEFEELQKELDQAEKEAEELEKSLKESAKVNWDRVSNQLQSVSKGLENAAKKTAVLSAGALGAIAGINKLGKDAVETGDTIQTTADQYNLSAEAIQKWNYIALQSDVASDQLYKSMTKARDAIGTAIAGGTSTAKTALEALIGDLGNVPTDTEGAFTTVINALAGVEDSTLQAYYANEIFGERIATQIIPLLNQGADGIARLSQEFEAVGYLTNEQVRALADYDNELNNVNTRLDNAKTQLGISMIPIMERFVDILENNIIPAIQSLTDWFNDLSPSMQGVITGGLLMFAALSPAFSILSKIVGVLPSLIDFLKKTESASLKTYAGFAALAGSIGLAFDLIGNWEQMSTVEKILKSLALAALVAAAAVTVFHSSWSLGLAIGAITAGVVAGIAAIKAAGEDIGVDTSEIDNTSSNYNTGNYSIPESTGNYGSYTDQTSNYNDYSNIVINIEKSDAMDEDAIIRAVNRGLKQAKQSRT